MRFLFLLLFLLAGCARGPLASDIREGLDKVGAVSLLGDDLWVDMGGAKLLASNAKSFDVPWDIDNTFRELFKQGIVDRGRDYVPLELGGSELEKIAKVREGRFRKTIGKQSQALMDTLFETAAAKGMRYFFLLTPAQSRERFPLQRGSYGAFCDGATKDARAYVYFFFDFALYDVAARKKIFFAAVDPSVTEAMTFGDCRVIAELKDPARLLEDPVKKTAALVVDALFGKMGWAKP